MASNSTYRLMINGGDIITDISYTANSLVTFPALPSPPTPTIKQLGNDFNINLEFKAALTPTSQVASKFTKACVKSAHTYSTSLEPPTLMDFYFEVVVNFKTPAGNGTANLYLGGYGGYWWLGGSSVDNGGGNPVIRLAVGDSGTPFTLRLSSALNLFEVSGIYPIKHVFVLMLENHSFDCMFAMSGIPGIKAATTNDYNVYNDKKYYVTKGAPTTMPADPGHEFNDTLMQLAGPGTSYAKNGPYPPINNSGFVTDFATKTKSKFGDIIAAFDTPTQLPVLYQLATKYTLCDHWFSSLPGPTWPNRFFVHGASSAGLDHSPSAITEMAVWEYHSGFVYPHGSIYDAMNNSNVTWSDL